MTALDESIATVGNAEALPTDRIDLASPGDAPGLDRVVIVSDDAVPSGGAGIMALATARLARASNVPVTLLSGSSERDPALAADGIEVVDLGGSHILEGSRINAATRGIHDKGVAERLAAWLARHDTPRTVYHLHNWHKVLSPSALHALRPVARRLVISAHDFFLACPNGGFFNYVTRATCELSPMSASCIATSCDKRSYAQKLWRVARHLARQRALDLASSGATVLVVHEAMAPLMSRGGIPANVMRVLRNPISPWLDERVCAEANATVLYVGRLETDKGIDVLAEAARRAGVALSVVGDGPLRSSLAAAYPEVAFHGRLGHAEISQMARTARLLVVPTLVRETFGMVALEGLMSGLPTLITTSALICNEICALGMAASCPPGDIDGLARALSALVSPASDLRVRAMSETAFAGARALAPTDRQWQTALLDIYRDKLRV